MEVSTGNFSNTNEERHVLGLVVWKQPRTESSLPQPSHAVVHLPGILFQCSGNAHVWEV